MGYVVNLIRNDEPVLFWENQFDPFVIGTIATAHSGKVAITRKTVPSGEVGKPMNVRFTCARKAHLDTWSALVEDDPFATTSLGTNFVTGKSVIFLFSENLKPIIYQNMVLRDGNYDIEQDIFDYTHDDYCKGFDWWEGRLHLLIVG